LTENIDPEILKKFLIEAFENLERVDQDLIKLKG
jgi:hypothetical protein